MRVKELYLHLAQACEHTAGITDLPDKRAGMLASAAVWRRLANAIRPSAEAVSTIQPDKLAVLQDLEADSVIFPFSSSKN
ncbi:hypothetical protein [Reyranella soli]|nr:hypothetical protein [Reyranella soli]